MTDIPTHNTFDYLGFIILVMIKKPDPSKDDPYSHTGFISFQTTIDGKRFGFLYDISTDMDLVKRTAEFTTDLNNYLDNLDIMA